MASSYPLDLAATAPAVTLGTRPAGALITSLMSGAEQPHPDAGGRPPSGAVRLTAEDDPLFWELFWTSSCSWPQRTGDLRTVTRWADFFPTKRARRANPMREVLGVEEEMMLSLPAPPGHARRILLLRVHNDAFTDRDRQVLELLRPHVEDVWLDAERRRAGVPRLTDREWQVLALVGGGMSHAEVARVLYLSPATVRKHMEHIRERLGVHSAAAAAARALPHAPTRIATQRLPGT